MADGEPDSKSSDFRDLAVSFPGFSGALRFAVDIPETGMTVKAFAEALYEAGFPIVDFPKLMLGYQERGRTVIEPRFLVPAAGTRVLRCDGDRVLRTVHLLKGADDRDHYICDIAKALAAAPSMPAPHVRATVRVHTDEMKEQGLPMLMKGLSLGKTDEELARFTAGTEPAELMGKALRMYVHFKLDLAAANAPYVDKVLAVISGGNDRRMTGDRRAGGRASAAGMRGLVPDNEQRHGDRFVLRAKAAEIGPGLPEFDDQGHLSIEFARCDEHGTVEAVDVHTRAQLLLDKSTTFHVQLVGDSVEADPVADGSTELRAAHTLPIAVNFWPFFAHFNPTSGVSASKLPPLRKEDLTKVEGLVRPSLRVAEDEGPAFLELVKELDSWTRTWKGTRSFVLYGPPGVGKTYHVGKIASMSGMACLTRGVAPDKPAPGPQLLNQPWVGDAELIVENWAWLAKTRPYLLHALVIDELHYLVRHQTKHGGGGHTSDKTVLMLDHLGDDKLKENVVFIGMTNYVAFLDTAVRRRFDRLLYVGPLTFRSRRQAVVDVNRAARLRLNDQQQELLVAATACFTYPQWTSLKKRLEDPRAEGTWACVVKHVKDVGTSNPLCRDRSLLKLEEAQDVPGRAAHSAILDAFALAHVADSRIAAAPRGGSGGAESGSDGTGARSKGIMSLMINDRLDAAESADGSTLAATRVNWAMRHARLLVSRLVITLELDHVVEVGAEFLAHGSNESRPAEALTEVFADARAADGPAMIILDMSALVGLTVSSITLTSARAEGTSVVRTDHEVTSRGEQVGTSKVSGWTRVHNVALGITAGKMSSRTVNEGKSHTDGGGASTASGRAEGVAEHESTTDATSTSVSLAVCDDRETTADVDGSSTAKTTGKTTSLSTTSSAATSTHFAHTSTASTAEATGQSTGSSRVDGTATGASGSTARLSSRMTGHAHGTASASGTMTQRTTSTSVQWTICNPKVLHALKTLVGKVNRQERSTDPFVMLVFHESDRALMAAVCGEFGVPTPLAGAITDAFLRF